MHFLKSCIEKTSITAAKSIFYQWPVVMFWVNQVEKTSCYILFIYIRTDWLKPPLLQCRQLTTHPTLTLMLNWFIQLHYPEFHRCQIKWQSLTRQSKHLYCSKYYYWLDSWLWGLKSSFLLFPFFNFICTFFFMKHLCSRGIFILLQHAAGLKILCMETSFWDKYISTLKHFTSSAASPCVSPGSLWSSVGIATNYFAFGSSSN